MLPWTVVGVSASQASAQAPGNTELLATCLPGKGHVPFVPVVSSKKVHETQA
jgi:hypothetical protein